MRLMSIQTNRQSVHREGRIVDEDESMLVTMGGAYGQTLGGVVWVVSKAFGLTGGGKRRKV